MNDVFRDTLTIILAGGVGSRLYPLTKDRAKPAVPFGGGYRILDFALTNCLHSGLRKIVVLTQYKSDSLGRHLQLGWNLFNYELGEFIRDVPPQHRITTNWYLGTADAIYQNIYTLQRMRPKRVLILSGDHLYKMDYRKMIQQHVREKAALTVAAVEVPIEDGKRFGVIQMNDSKRMVGFEEKPDNPKPMPGHPSTALGSMGVYVFDTGVLVRAVSEDAKQNTEHDFGKNIIPKLMDRERVMVHPFDSYWRDIGTVESYFDANMDLLADEPALDIFDPAWTFRSFQPQYPPARVKASITEQSFIGPGCRIDQAEIRRSVLSPNIVIGEGSSLEECIVFEGVRIGRNCRLKRAILDKHVVLPDNASIGFDEEADQRKFTISPSGIRVVPKGLNLVEELSFTP